MGLHKRCSSVTGTCVSFPQEQDCAANNGSFCHMWRTIGFLMSLAVVIELCTVVSFVVIMAGGVQRRIAGYKVISSLLIFSALVQCAGMSIVVCFAPLQACHGSLGSKQRTTLIHCRPTSSKTTTASSKAGTSTPLSASPPPLGPSSPLPRWA
jgi:hypothetical protein